MAILTYARGLHDCSILMSIGFQYNNVQVSSKFNIGTEPRARPRSRSKAIGIKSGMYSEIERREHIGAMVGTVIGRYKGERIMRCPSGEAAGNSSPPSISVKWSLLIH
ncbi:hypothetical protein EVAR_11627_1 [Eumeta japonica]|uniref:Uncharacterized protein n=1 Tax=Eumeta variegata TaxID=151549 RepID=A0A4C1WXX2_EUMVA|nr:hypothetical protein EVAR_11627_1 [Eumeta japonica]